MIIKHLHQDEMGRYPAIDIFRGVAIFTMLAANAAAESLAPPHHFAFRIYGSFAAPIFVFLAGFMIAAGYGKHSPAYFLRRGLEIILVGALIDVLIWRIVPLTTFDVLYLIGFGICLAGTFMKLNTPVRVTLTLLCLGAGPLLQQFVAYDERVHEFELAGFSFSELPQGFSWWIKSWLTDGWFPVFPWLGILFAGTLAVTHGAQVAKRTAVFLPFGIVLFLSGLSWLFFHRPIESREGYSELFYPPGIPYLFAASGAIITGLSLMRFFKQANGLQLLRYLGSCSLFIYILHSAVIDFVLDAYFTNLSLEKFTLMYVLFAAAMIACARVLLEMKKKSSWKKVPKPLRFIFG
jgi:uncharacterized membrane protein